ncbi:hypothetical protein E2562_017009 [Oryza meyeriana var. granulata]|uniref:Uncharacterized protein n=1 Tax=Oryza meyeriana var. granulata TaxID=110450 RepID=A0A6G1EAP8_9ORYZ|nr:hypothetical protein E2562_017009 [Oryza meyeriana var. granulata]
MGTGHAGNFSNHGFLEADRLLNGREAKERHRLAQVTCQFSKTTRRSGAPECQVRYNFRSNIEDTTGPCSSS